jgi:Glyoxalase-like domain
VPQPYPHGELVIVIDCSDLDRSAQFWAAVLGYTAGPPGAGPCRGLRPESGVGIDVLLQRVPDVKRQKNRLHLDLRTPDLGAEVERVLALGATLLTSQPVTPTATSSASSSPPPEPTPRVSSLDDTHRAGLS